MATLRVTNLKGRTGNVAPDLPDGANITGFATATNVNVSAGVTAGIGTFTTSVVVGSAVTANADGVITSGIITATSFAGDGSSLTGIDATTVKDSGGTTRVAGNTSGIEVTGISTFSGAVGIGTAPQSAEGLELTIRSSDGQTNVGLVPNANTESTQISFYNATNDSTQGYIKYDNNTNNLKFRVNLAERVVFDKGGNVSITGICTATSFSGDGSALTGIDAGVTTTSQYNQSGVITINLGTGQGHEVTLAAGISTITVTGGTAGASHHLILTQPSSGITTVGFSTYFLWPSGSPPDLSRSSASSEIDMITFVVKQQTQTGTGVTQLLASAGIDYQ